MYEKFVSEAKESFKPVLDIVDINTRAVEKLVKQQAACLLDVLKFNLEHTRALADSKDFEAVLESNQLYAKDLGQKLADAAKQNLDVMLEAKDALNDIFESSLKNVKVKTAPSAKKAA